MKKLLFTLFACISLQAFARPQDSIGVKTMNGKQYVMHKVCKGEGVFGISKKYGVTANDIYVSNAGTDKGIKIDQVLLIPRRGGATATSNQGSASVSTKKTEKKFHTVASGQTLSLIAKKYNTSIEDIKQLNNLKSDNIQLGQKLIVGETITYAQQTSSKPAERTVAKVEEVPEIPAEEVKKENKPVEKNIEKAPDNVVVSSEKIMADKNNNKPAAIITNTYTVEDGDEVSENGMAIISNDGELNQERSFILHPTAKIGTIIMITNPVNNNAVFARVVGTCKNSNDYILKMSKTVADKLGINADSAVKINYAR